MFAVDPPPVVATAPAPKPAEVVIVSRDAHSDILASLDTPLPLAKGRRVEDALLRQAISLTSTLTVVRSATGEMTLRWTYQSYLQRQLCFTSITGQFSCAAAESEELPQKVSGETPLPATPGQDAAPFEVTPGQAATVPAAAAPASPDANPDAAAARAAVVTTLRDQASVLFGDDRRLKFDPMLKAARVGIRRTRVVTGHRASG
jgi:hypothetical protein